MGKLKTALIGAGKVADIHASALLNLPESEFIGVYSRTWERCQALAKKYQVQPYTDLDALLASGVQAVIIGTPHPNHAAPAIRACQAGVHVLVEKPLAASLQDCDAMIAAADANRVTLAMISQRRLYPPVQRLHQAIQDGKIGRPILGIVTMLGWRDKSYYNSDPWRGSWRMEGGGVLVNQSPHQLDILQWFMGPIDELFGYWANFNHAYIDVEDTAVAVIRFRSGALGQVVVSNSMNPALYGRVHVHGSTGASLGVQTDGGAMFIAGLSTIVEPPFNDIWTVEGESDHLPLWKQADQEFFAAIDPTSYFHQLQVEDFLQAIQHNRPPLVDGREGRKTVELFTALYRSQRDRRPVRFPLQAETGRADYDGRLG